MISYLKDVFSNVPTLALSAIIIPIVLEYICKSLKFCSATKLDWESLERANITYIVLKIVKPNFENLGFLIHDSRRVGLISKTMIFVDSIDET